MYSSVVRDFIWNHRDAPTAISHGLQKSALPPCKNTFRHIEVESVTETHRNAKIHIFSHTRVTLYINLIKIFRVHQFHVVLVLRIFNILRIHIREIGILGIFQFDESGFSLLPASFRTFYVFGTGNEESGRDIIRQASAGYGCRKRSSSFIVIIRSCI